MTNGVYTIKLNIIFAVRHSENGGSGFLSIAVAVAVAGISLVVVIIVVLIVRR